MSASAPGEHGGDGRLVAASLGLDPAQVLDLSLSLNPFAPDPTPVVRRHLAAGVLGRYPGSRRARARRPTELAAVLGVDRRRVLLTNGGAEAIALVAGRARTGLGGRTGLLSLLAPHRRSGIPPGRGSAPIPTTRAGGWPRRRARPRSGTRPSTRWPPDVWSAPGTVRRTRWCSAR